MKILLVQIASTGDCLLVTPIAKQIKEFDYPGCELTWMIGSLYKHVILHNPYIDHVIEIQSNTINDTQLQRERIHEHIENAGGHSQYEKVFITDFTDFNSKNWYGTTRSSLLRSYPHPLRVNPQPLIFLTDEEKSNVAKFCKNNKITTDSYNILFECAPRSGQSSMTIERAIDLSKKILQKDSRVKFILTSSHPFSTDNQCIIDASEISWRENAELANYCNLILGCSSGISWLCTSNWVNPIKFIQAIDHSYADGRASMKIDFKYFNLETKNLIELNEPSDEILENCILSTAANNFRTVQLKYDLNVTKAFLNYKFLRESQIPPLKKTGLLIRYFLGGTFLLFWYRVLKPKWFTTNSLGKKMT